MLAIRTSVLIAVAIALPSVSVAQAFEYAAGTSRYRVTRATRVAQEAMGQKQEFESSESQVVTVTISRPSKDTMAMVIVLDSITATSPMGPAPGLDKMLGMRVDARLSPSGTFFTASGARDSSVAGATEIAESMGRFLPRIRRPLANGASWADTTSGRVATNGMELNRKTFSTYRVAGDTTVAGEKSWRIVKEDSTAMTGSNAAQGATMEGTSIGKGVLLMSQRGAFLGGEGDESAKLRVVIASSGLEVSVTQTAKTKVSKAN
jgi:hypothetical protein